MSLVGQIAVAVTVIQIDLWVWWILRRRAKAQMVAARNLWGLSTVTYQFPARRADQRELELTPAEQAERQNAKWWRRVGGIPEQLRQTDGRGY